MVDLMNTMLSNKTIKIFLICIVIFLLFEGFIWKRKIEKEKDFIKIINRRFLFKYVIMIMLIFGIVFIIASYVLVLVYPKIGKYLFVCSFTIILISVEWAFIFDRTNIYYNFSKDDIVKQYILFFAKNKMRSFKYVELITWFSRWNHKNFCSKNDDEQEVDQLITKLELLLRPYDNILCLASRHKNDFIKLCTKLADFESNEKLKEIENTANEMEKKPSEEYRYFLLSLDHNILTYLAFIVLHIVASILMGNDIKNIFANILFYIPSDILIILVYKGIISEREVSKK